MRSKIDTAVLGPDFLCIGAQRSGTTWLYENLKGHPDFDMPPHKEIHYFNKREERVFSWKSIFFLKKRVLFKSRAQDNFHSLSFRTLKWDLRYLFCARNDDWYRVLLTGLPGKLRGDISPAYSTLDICDVKRIGDILPSVKVIFLLRNPMSRAWSHAKMDFTNFGKIDIASVTLQEFVSHFESSASLLRTDYARTLRIWESVIAPERMYIGFFDDIVRRPKMLLTDICNFLGASSDEVNNLPLTNVRINESTMCEAPAEIALYLTTKYQDSLVALYQRFGWRVKSWLDNTTDELK